MDISKILLLCVGIALATHVPPLSSSDFDNLKIDYTSLIEGFRSAVSAGPRPGYDEASWRRTMSSFHETSTQTTESKHLNATSQIPDSDTSPKPIFTVVATNLPTVLTLTPHGVFSSDLATMSQVDTIISAQATSRLPHATDVRADGPTTFDTAVRPTSAIDAGPDTASQIATTSAVSINAPAPVVSVVPKSPVNHDPDTSPQVATANAAPIESPDPIAPATPESPFDQGHEPDAAPQVDQHGPSQAHEPKPSPQSPQRKPPPLGPQPKGRSPPGAGPDRAHPMQCSNSTRCMEGESDRAGTQPKIAESGRAG